MHIFTQKLDIPAGVPLGGYAELSGLTASDGGVLEINGLHLHDAPSNRGYGLAAIDALYPGDLALEPDRNGYHFIFAASHTHSAPMLDSTKPRLGALCPASLAAFRSALDHAPRETVACNRVLLFRGETPVPVYRRFDVPPGLVNRLLSRHAGFFPNNIAPIERSLYVWLFSRGQTPLYSIIYHACHPVTRSVTTRISADYIATIRTAVRMRFGTPICIFLQGCGGDIRPDFSHKRCRWLPRNRFNWRFKAYLEPADERLADASYAHAIETAVQVAEGPVAARDVRVSHRTLRLRNGGNVEAVDLTLSPISRFRFVPFEVSHFYNQFSVPAQSRRLIVSCAGRTLGYLPHPSQFPFGGYEVDSSLAYMSLDYRLELDDEL